VPGDLSTTAWIGVAALVLLIIVALVMAGLRARIRRLVDNRERCILALMVARARSARNGQFYLDEILVLPLDPRLRQLVMSRLDRMTSRKLVVVAEIQEDVKAQGDQRSRKRFLYQFTPTGESWLKRLSEVKYISRA
jgi:hypothetical protein